VILALAASLALAVAPTPTATPDPVVSAYNAGLSRSLYVGSGGSSKLAWLVTATATMTPTPPPPTPQPTPTGDCCRDGHAWQPIKVGKEYAGGQVMLHYLEWERRGIDPRRKSRNNLEFYDQISVTVQRCRRCGLWREIP
jgi:hypothetical protein